MKEWLRILPIFLLFFGVLTFLDHTRWLYNLIWALALTAIGCVGQYLIHKNVLEDNGDDQDSNGCINCGKP